MNLIRPQSCQLLSMLIALMVSSCTKQDNSEIHTCGNAPMWCDLEPGTSASGAPTADNCQATGLPFLSESDWSVSERERLEQGLSRGSVAVEHDPGGTRVVEDCALDGTYTEVVGEAGSGRFWATNRVLFLMTEISGPCQTATHVVAAFAKRGTRSGAILVPLPCPSTAEERPAPGCVGRGLTGPERRARALALIESTKADPTRGSAPWPPGIALGSYALQPDHYEGYASLNLNFYTCSLRPQVWFVLNNYERPDSPRFNPPMLIASARDLEAIPAYQMRGTGCDDRPPFLECFPELFDPAPAEGCWKEAAVPPTTSSSTAHE